MPLTHSRPSIARQTTFKVLLFDFFFLSHAEVNADIKVTDRVELRGDGIDEKKAGLCERKTR